MKERKLNKMLWVRTTNNQKWKVMVTVELLHPPPLKTTHTPVLCRCCSIFISRVISTWKQLYTDRQSDFFFTVGIELRSMHRSAAAQLSHISSVLECPLTSRVTQNQSASLYHVRTWMSAVNHNQGSWGAVLLLCTVEASTSSYHEL